MVGLNTFVIDPNVITSELLISRIKEVWENLEYFRGDIKIKMSHMEQLSRISSKLVVRLLKKLE